MLCTQCGSEIKTGEQACEKCKITLELSKLKGVKGWLLFLCLNLTIYTPLVNLVYIILGWEGAARLFRALPGLKTLVIVEIILLIGLMVFSFYAGYALWSVKPNAVKIAKIFLLALVVISILSPFIRIGVANSLNLPSEFTKFISKEEILEAGRGIISFVIWFTYLCQSKRVRATYSN